MKKVLVVDTLPELATVMLEQAGFEVDYRPGLSEDEFKEAAKDANGIVCRSGAKVTEAVLASAQKLEVVCRAGVGVDNIDVAAASRRGVVVMNTPGANAVSTAEHTFALMLALARNIGPAYVSMRQGRWEKKKFVGSQLSGRTLGIIGLGRIGQEVAKRAVAFGMNVRAYDPYLSRERAERIGVGLVESLGELLSSCDYVSIHIPENEQTRDLIGATEIALMRDGACIINCARGSLVDQEAVVAAVEGGKLGGAAFDVYAKEPLDNYEFTCNDRILATPHLAASTDEAQLAVAMEAAEQLIEALHRGHFRNALNVSLVPPEEMKALEPYCDLAARLGKLVAQLNSSRPVALEIACKGEIAHDNIEPVVNYGAMGFMQSSLGGDVNIVSARYLAEERGIRITSSRTSGPEAGFTDLIEVKLTTDGGALEVAGTLFGRERPRIVRIGDFYVEVEPQGHVLIVFNNDMPGCIGWVGAALGAAGINIARMGVCRQQVGGNALLAFNLDSPCDQDILDKINELDLVQRVVAIEL